MATIDQQYVLTLSREEAEILHCFIEHNMAREGCDPQYEAWGWEHTGSVLTLLLKVLPSAD